MKKLLLIASLIMGMTGMSFAQTAKPKKDKPAAAQTTSAAKPAGPMKKDGTPDRRFKANKLDSARAAGPLKKDGTPDRRYKANKKS